MVLGRAHQRGSAGDVAVTVGMITRSGHLCAGSWLRYPLRTRRRAMGIKGIDHWVIVAGNLDRTLDFYSRLGFTIAWEERPGRPRMPTIRINDAQKINVHGPDWPERT